MAEIVNLRMARKRRNRAAEADAAQENRIRHGRDKLAKVQGLSERQKRERTVDNARLDDDQTPRRD